MQEPQNSRGTDSSYTPLPQIVETPRDTPRVTDTPDLPPRVTDGHPAPDVAVTDAPNVPEPAESEQDEDFIDSRRARDFVGAVIVLDLVCLGVEADNPGPIWDTVEAVLVGFYTVEMCLLVYQKGVQCLIPSEVFLHKNYRTKTSDAMLNHFRLLIVVLGIADVWVRALGWPRSQLVCMYLRLLRAIRIFTLFNVLARFALALLYMTQHLAWIFFVMALVSYISAVFFTVYTKDNEIEDAEEFFSDVWLSAFSLFQVTTMDNWHAISLPLVKYHWGWAWFFVVFIAFTSWTMISLLTAVVSEQIILATRDMKVRETELVEQRHHDFVLFLKRCFKHADTDNNGVLDKTEFTELIKEEIVTRKMEDLGVIIQHEELKDTFDMLDVDESGELTIDEFTLGLSQLQQSLGIKHVLSINYAIQRIHRKLQRQLQGHTDITNQKFERLCAKVDDLSSKVMSQDHVDEKVAMLERQLARLTELNQLRASTASKRIAMSLPLGARKLTEGD